MVDGRTFVGVFFCCIGIIRTTRCGSDLPADTQPHRFTHMDSTSHIDACSISDIYGHSDCNDHTGSLSHSNCDVDADSDSDADSNRHRFIDVISHRDEYICSHWDRDKNFDRDDYTDIHTRPHADAASLSDT